MNIYKLLSENIELIKRLTQLGVIAPNWLRNYHLIKDYEELQKEVRAVMFRYAILAERYKISEDQVRRIIRESKE